MKDLTDTQNRVLLWLKKCKEPATPELVAAMQPQFSMIAPSRIKKILLALHRKGYVITPPCADGVARFLPVSDKML